MVSECRRVLISMIRVSYNYEEEEDEEENELPGIEQDRLIKTLISSLGAGEIVGNCKSCFIDFYDKQKKLNFVMLLYIHIINKLYFPWTMEKD
jgi:hypothetical protein